MNPFVLLLTAVVILPFVWILLRQRVVRRLAIRNARRRPTETALVILGSLFGTAIITGSLVVGTTLSRSIRQQAYSQLGPIDLLVSSREPAEYDTLVQSLANLDEHDDIDGVLAFSTLPVSVTAGKGNEIRSAPRSLLIEADLAKAREFGRDPASTGIEGETPRDGEAVITESLAEMLEVGPQDEISIVLLGQTLDLKVVRILPQKGVAGFVPNAIASTGANVFITPGRLDLVRKTLGERETETRELPPELLVSLPQYYVAISNRGGVEEGNALTAQVTTLIEERTTNLNATVQTVKQDILRTADESGDRLSQLFAAMGTFGALAGVLLLVNLFVMLSEERKTELGMLRAIGMTRRLLVSTFAAEGWVYAFIASAIGTFAGLGLGRIIIFMVDRAIAQVGEEIGLQLIFSFTWESIGLGFALGLAVSAFTIVVTSLRIARINIIRAIRRLPEPQNDKTAPWVRALGACGVIAGAAATVNGFVNTEQYGILLGPVLFLLGLLPLAKSRFPFSTTVPLAALLAMIWGSLALRVMLEDLLDEPDIGLFIAQGICLTTAAVGFLTYQQERIARTLRRFFPKGRTLSLHIGLAYPLARLFRTGLTVAMYALVIFTLTFVTVLSHVITEELHGATTELSGGYDVLVRSSPTNPVPFDEIRELPEVNGVAPMSLSPVQFMQKTPARTSESSEQQPTFWFLSTFDKRFLQSEPPTLSDRGDFPSDKAAYEAVLSTPNKIIVDPLFMASSLRTLGPIEVGSTLVAQDLRSGDTIEVSVAAIGSTDLVLNGVLTSPQTAEALFHLPPVQSRAYVVLDKNTDPEAFSRSLEKTYTANGAEVDPFSKMVDDATAIENQFFELAQGYLALGLIVGIAGLGVVMVRAVRERRRQIGVLRSLGFQPGRIGRSLIVEAGFVALEGTFVGLVLAIVTSYNIVSSTDLFGTTISFSVPWMEIFRLGAATIFISLAATAGPARAASHIQPAVALRMTD